MLPSDMAPPSGLAKGATVGFGPPARVGVDEDVGCRERRQDASFSSNQNGVDGLERQVGVEVGVHLNVRDWTGGACSHLMDIPDRWILKH